VTSDRLLLTSVDSCEFVGLWGGEVKKLKLKLKLDSKYLGIRNILEFAWPQKGSAAVLAVLRARLMRLPTLLRWRDWVIFHGGNG